MTDMPNMPAFTMDAMQMAPATPAPALAAPTTSPAPARRNMMQRGASSLHRMASMIAVGGLPLIAGLVALELIAKDEYQPTKVLARWQASHDLTEMQAKNPGMMIVSEADYQAKMAEAQRAGQAKAELTYQTQLATVQANQQRVIGAYQTLYQRANMIAQAGLGMEAQLQSSKSQAMAGAQAGNQMIATYGDIACAIGWGGCEAAAAAKERLQTDIENTRTGEVGQRINQLMSDVPDPAHLITGADIGTNGAPALPH